VESFQYLDAKQDTGNGGEGMARAPRPAATSRAPVAAGARDNYDEAPDMGAPKRLGGESEEDIPF
jgi:hypothetical protein